jgi:hypothetical protein
MAGRADHQPTESVQPTTLVQSAQEPLHIIAVLQYDVDVQTVRSR